jgi:hypothetical protein
MNEQVKELMQQAGTDTSGKWMGVDHAEKFAKLIVRECIEQVFYTIEDEEQDNISGSIRDRIKQHFGVEK